MSEKKDISAKEIKTAVKLPEEDEEVFTLSGLIFDWSNAFMIALIIIVMLLTFGFRQVTVNGDSMNDTLQSGDKLILYSFMYKPQNGDIVVISHGKDYSDPIIKRVIAVEGQSLKINYDTGEVTLDGVVLKEDYIKGLTKRVHPSLEIPDVIPEGYVFVMGDNRENSLDSRSTQIGLIPVENIIGKAELRILPASSFGSVY